MEQAEALPTPPGLYVQRHFPRAGKQAFAPAHPHLVVFQIHRLDFIRRRQISSVYADKAISEPGFQFIEAAQKVHPAVSGMEQDMMGKGGGFKKENIAQGDMPHHIPRPQCERFGGVLPLSHQARMDFPQTPAA